MALIICPECGKEISDKANHCIGCGFPLSDKTNVTVENAIQSETVYEFVQEVKTINADLQIPIETPVLCETSNYEIETDAHKRFFANKKMLKIIIAVFIISVILIFNINNIKILMLTQAVENRIFDVYNSVATASVTSDNYLDIVIEDNNFDLLSYSEMVDYFGRVSLMVLGNEQDLKLDTRFISNIEIKNDRHIYNSNDIINDTVITIYRDGDNFSASDYYL